MRRLVPVQILLFVFFLSCEKDCEIRDITDQCIFHEEFLSPCFHGITSSEYNEIVISDTTVYYQFGHAIRIFPCNLNCDTARLPPIDFSKYTLLGKRTYGGGCTAEYVRQVFEDKCEKMIIYEINVEYSGGCDMLIGNWNWVYIPKLPVDFTVAFRVSQNR